MIKSPDYPMLYPVVIPSLSHVFPIFIVIFTQLHHGTIQAANILWLRCESEVVARGNVGSCNGVS